MNFAIYSKLVVAPPPPRFISGIFILALKVAHVNSYLVICSELPGEVIVGRSVSHLTLDHRRVAVQVLLDVIHHLFPSDKQIMACVIK